jgi:hypothetical protein
MKFLVKNSISIGLSPFIFKSVNIVVTLQKNIKHYEKVILFNHYLV